MDQDEFDEEDYDDDDDEGFDGDMNMPYTYDDYPSTEYDEDTEDDDYSSEDYPNDEPTYDEDKSYDEKDYVIEDDYGQNIDTQDNVARATLDEQEIYPSKESKTKLKTGPVDNYDEDDEVNYDDEYNSIPNESKSGDPNNSKRLKDSTDDEEERILFSDDV